MRNSCTIPHAFVSKMPLSKRLLSTLLAAVLSAAAGSVAADGLVYKIVGPDGKITYSDRPPTDARQRASVVNRAAASVALVMPPPITAITPWASLSGDARRGIVPALPLGETAASRSVVTYALADALSSVFARAELVQTMRDICVRSAPSAYSAYDESARRWQERNAAVVAQAERVLQNAFDGPQRAKLQATAHTRLSGILTPLASSPVEAKILWCDASADALVKGALDMQGAASVAAPVTNFVIR